jgi:hypothetical protein
MDWLRAFRYRRRSERGAVVIRPDTLQTTLANLDYRLRTLETARQLDIASVREGALSVQDAAGIERARVGKQSDGTYGIRLLDATGAVVFDPIGLRGVMYELGSHGFSSASNQTMSGGTDVISGTSFTFNVPRDNTTIFVMMQMALARGTSPAGYASVSMGDSTNTFFADTAYNLWGQGLPPNNYYTPIILWEREVLNAGSYTWRATAFDTAGAVISLNTGNIEVFSLGR